MRLDSVVRGGLHHGLPLVQHALGPAWRGLTVMAWGRNTEAAPACGVETLPLVASPTVLLDLHGREDIVGVRAGKLSSAAVTAGGEVLTWGDGRSAQLGHGNDDPCPSPARVEALVGRAEVSAVALGDQHSLFLDRAGGVWAVGCSLEGQLGLGQPLEELAAQQRRALQGSLQLEALLRGRPGLGAGAAGRSSGGGGFGSGFGGGRHEAYLRSFAEAHWAGAGGGAPWADRAWRAAAAAASGRQPLPAAFLRPPAPGLQFAGGGGGGGGGAIGGGSGGGGGGGPQLGISSSGVWGVDLERHLRQGGLTPGVVPVPARVEAPRLTPSRGGGGAAAGAAPDEGEAADNGSSSGGGPPGLEEERVVGIDCSRFYSICVTDRGEVWTFGASYTGALGQGGTSWSTGPRRIEGAAAAAVEAEGGAVAVAAGGAGAACLTASGKVILLGGFATPPPGGRPAPSTAAERAAAADAARLGFAVAAIPAPVRSIAAGQQHVLMSDGERVWAVGRWLDGGGAEAGVAPFYAPRELLHLPDEGIAKVVAGAHSSGAVTGDGRLFLAGRLLERHHAEALLHKHGAPPGAAAAVDWSWPGFGGADLAPVPGVSGVVDCGLGGWHAVVLAR